MNQLFWSLKLDRLAVEYNNEVFEICVDEECLVTPDSGSSALTAPSWAMEQLSQFWFPRGSVCQEVFDSKMSLV